MTASILPMPDSPLLWFADGSGARRTLHMKRKCEWWIGYDDGRSAQAAARPKRARKPTLASVAKQASKAGLEVARYEVKPDGSIVVVTGKGEQQQGNEVDEWIAKHADKTQRH